MQDLLATAVRLHQGGRLREAEAAYRRVLQESPRNSEALHMFGLLAHEAGDHKAAAELIRGATEIQPERSLYHFNLGVVLAAAGDSAGAEAAYRACLAREPAHADAETNLGLLYHQRGEPEDAAACFRRAIERQPGHAAAHANLGRSLHDLGDLESALASFERALELDARLAEAQFGRGRALEDRDRWAEAEAAYRAALGLRPGFREAQNNLAAVLLAQGRYGEAREAFADLRRLTRGPLVENPQSLLEAPPRSGRARPGQSPGPTVATRFSLLDRAQQLEWLLAKGALDPGFAEVAARLRAVLEELGPADGPDWKRALSEEQARCLGGALGRILHYADAPRLAGPAVNPALGLAAIEEAYLSAEPPIVHFDDFLTPEALAGLRSFCHDSTVYFGADPAGFVSSYMADGFNCSLMYQIAEELKARLPRVLGPHHLSNMWSYRHGAEGAGVLPHTDFAAVTFNFWIAPESANLEPESGGLIVYAKEEPADWDWLEVNRDKSRPDMRARIESFLEDAPQMTIPHRENRAVMFHSNLFHKSDRLRFADGFESRRINVSLLFGRLGTGSRAAKSASEG